MRLDTSQYIPVNFTKSADDLEGGSNVQNMVIGALFLAVLYQLFKGKRGGASTGRKVKGKKDAGKPDDKKGGFFGGGGGMNDMFGMSKSNAK